VDLEVVIIPKVVGDMHPLVVAALVLKVEILLMVLKVVVLVVLV
tara:strand:- start:126 stop:257 length:132 start_codon:yes stop_codon:yes gene_type:complete